MSSSQKNILVLGNRGMLGSVVEHYLSKNPQLNVIGDHSYWPPDLTPSQLMIETGLGSMIGSCMPHYIVNCVGAIPQKGAFDFSINSLLPSTLCHYADHLGYKVLNPSTDCEFSGDIAFNKYYESDAIPDAEDDYGKSKIAATRSVLESGHGKVIRTSIVGFSPDKGRGLLDWLASNRGKKVTGFKNHFWNGITTLSWAQLCEYLIFNYDGISENLIQVAGQRVTKSDILHSANSVFDLGVEVVDGVSEHTRNKCLLPNFDFPSLDWPANRLILKQLTCLKEYMDEI